MQYWIYSVDTILNYPTVLKIINTVYTGQRKLLRNESYIPYASNTKLRREKTASKISTDNISKSNNNCNKNTHTERTDQ
jgi:hypothetical protein